MSCRVIWSLQERCNSIPNGAESRISEGNGSRDDTDTLEGTEDANN